MRYEFTSDNTAGLAPEAFEGLARANAGFQKSYGGDEISARCADLIRDKLQADAEIRFVFSGTAANAIALSMLAKPFETVLTHGHAHVCTDEAGAPAFFGQGIGLTKLTGPSAKISRASLDVALAEPEPGYVQPPGRAFGDPGHRIRRSLWRRGAATSHRAVQAARPGGARGRRAPGQRRGRRV